MKKLLMFVLAMVLVAGFAYSYDDRSLYTTVVSKTADAVLSTSEFDIVNDVLIGISVSGGQGAQAAVYDTSALGTASASLLVGEAEALYGIKGSDQYWFEYPVKFVTGVVVVINDTDCNDTPVVTLHIIKKYAR